LGNVGISSRSFMAILSLPASVCGIRSVESKDNGLPPSASGKSGQRTVDDGQDDGANLRIPVELTVRDPEARMVRRA